MIIETIRLKNTSICHLEAKQILYKRGINCFLFVWQRQRNITFESIILYVNCQVLPYFDKCFFFFFSVGFGYIGLPIPHILGLSF